MADTENGWKEPHLRFLRSAAVGIVLALLVWLVVVEEGNNDLATVGTLAGVLLVLLGFEAGVRWPWGNGR